jgi:pimeloyl-ACP methyl ester carboxylesterase
VKRIHFEPDTDGFYGAYWKNKKVSNSAMIAMLGDDPKDYMARCGVKWLHQLGVNVLTMAPNKKDYGHHNYPLERIEAAIAWLKAHGNEKIGIVGASATGTLALTAASYFSDLTLTIGMTPSDFIWQGFMKGKRDGCKAWPVEGEFLFSYHGEPLSYMPFVYQHPEFWKIVESEGKRTGDIRNFHKLYDDSEKAHPLTEEQMIRVENIKGRLLLIGAADDVLWDTARYIRRMEQRLKQRPHSCEVELLVYEYGTHFVFPETMLQRMMPVLGDAFVKMAFVSARRHPKECKQTRIDIDRRLRGAIREWMR